MRSQLPLVINYPLNVVPAFLTHESFLLGGYRFCPRTSLSDALSIFVSNLYFTCKRFPLLLFSRTSKPCSPLPNVPQEHECHPYYWMSHSITMEELNSSLLTLSPSLSSLIGLHTRNSCRASNLRPPWTPLRILTTIEQRGWCERSVVVKQP
jgi:hypothetical protein